MKIKNFAFIGAIFLGLALSVSALAATTNNYIKIEKSNYDSSTANSTVTVQGINSYSTFAGHFTQTITTNNHFYEIDNVNNPLINGITIKFPSGKILQSHGNIPLNTKDKVTIMLGHSLTYGDYADLIVNSKFVKHIIFS